MKDEGNRYNYDPLSVLVAWGSASLGACFLIFIFLFPFSGIFYGHTWQPGVRPSTFLFHTVWCITSYFAAAVFSWLAGDLLRRFIPSWLFISFCGTLIFTFTFWIYAYWDWVQTYQPGSPFQSPPPSFDAVLWSAAISSLFFFMFAAMFSFIASLIPLERDREGALHLND
jgi:hypothetical protein